MIQCSIIAMCVLAPIGSREPQVDLRSRAEEFLDFVGVPFSEEALVRIHARLHGDVQFGVTNLCSVNVRIRDGRVTAFHNTKISAERSFGLRRDVQMTMNTEDEARAKAQQLLVALGLDDEFEIRSVTLDPEEVSDRDPRRMQSWGTAHVKARKVGDPPSMRGSNFWSVSFDRHDGAVLSYGLVDTLRFIEEPDTIGDAGARRATEGIWSLIDADDPTQYPAEWRRVSAVEKGWSIVGKQWHDAYKAQHGREPEFGAIVPAYKVYFSNSPWWPGQDEPDWVIVRAFNGEVMHDARY